MDECKKPSPTTDDQVIWCNREANHEGPHRGNLTDDDVIFWSWGKPRRPLVRLQRDTTDRERWIIVDA